MKLWMECLRWSACLRMPFAAMWPRLRSQLPKWPKAPRFLKKSPGRKSSKSSAWAKSSGSTSK
eukprot:8508169-Alexandrium_andersonii.AAC.1